MPDAKIWPTLCFHSIMDDYRLGITHICRGADLKHSEKKQFLKLLPDIDYKFHICRCWGKNKFNNVTVSSSKVAKYYQGYKVFNYMTIDNFEYYHIPTYTIYHF